MPSKSFTVFARRCDVEPSRDGMVAVFNNHTPASGKVVRIHSIRSVQVSPANADVSNAAGLQGKIGLYRISAYSGGTERSPVAFDTAASALPAQVKVVCMPESVTTNGLIRAFGDAFSFSITGAVPFQAMLRMPGICDSRDHPSGEHVWWARMDDSLERIIVREGEGIACVRLAFGQPQSAHWSVTFRDESTGRCWRRAFSSTGTPDNLNQASWLFWNGSGSGAVYGVSAVGFPDFGESNIPRARVARITGIGWVSGDTVNTASVAAHDTATDVSGIAAYGGPFVAEVEGKGSGVNIDYLNYQGTEMTIARQQKIATFRHYLESDPWISLTHSPVRRFGDDDIVWDPQTSDPIMLQPGQGIAVLAGGNGLVETSEMAYADYEIIGEIVELASVYPAEADVRDGVYYGPTGTDYEGDLVAGGGSGMSRSRVVNA